MDPELGLQADLAERARHAERRCQRDHADPDRQAARRAVAAGRYARDDPGAGDEDEAHVDHDDGDDNHDDGNDDDRNDAYEHDAVLDHRRRRRDDAGVHEHHRDADHGDHDRHAHDPDDDRDHHDHNHAVKRRLAVLLIALAATFAPASAAHADDNGCPQGANCAIAINTQDNSSLFQFAFAVRHVLGDTVDAENGAVAYSSCTSCQTTAIAIEIVLNESTTTTNMSPQNAAVAVNDNCNLCETFATAYQFVINTGGPVEFTEQGKHELHDIREEIKSWGVHHLSNDEIRALLPGVIARLKTVLATQLVPADQHAGGNEDYAFGHRSNKPNPPPPPTTTGTTETSTDTTTTAPTDTSGTTTTVGTTTDSTTTGATTTTTP